MNVQTPGGVASLASALALAALVMGAMPARAQQRIERGARATADATIRIYNLSGATTVTGWDRDSVALVGTLEPGAGRLYIGGTGPAIKLGVESPSGDGAPRAARLEVRVPRGSVVWVKAADASIEVDGVEGGLDLYSVTGAIRVRGAPETVRAESMEGGITLDVRAPWARVKTASGRIQLAGEIGDLAATTVSGAIRVAASRQARARIESVTGPVVVSGRPSRGGAWEIETHSGSVTLELAPETDAEIAVHTFGGDVRADLGRVVSRRQDDLSGSELHIVAGTGGTSIAVRTFKGAVTVGVRS
jgi:hypothetical protein